MVEYASAKEAQDAIDAMHGQEFMTQPLHVTWCFVKGPSRKRGAGAGGGARR
jgi:RNA-binding protein 8A